MFAYILLLAHVLHTQASPIGSPIGITETHAGSDVHRLAAFSIQELKRSKGCDKFSNELVCAVHLLEVESAARQVVTGVSYRIRLSTSKGGAELAVVTQPWRDSISLAKFELDGIPLIEDALTLEAGNFPKFCVPRPCTREYAPVCLGSFEYSNRCVAYNSCVPEVLLSPCK